MLAPGIEEVGHTGMFIVQALCCISDVWIELQLLVKKQVVFESSHRTPADTKSVLSNEVYRHNRRKTAIGIHGIKNNA
jgi:hypothetical protein